MIYILFKFVFVLFNRLFRTIINYYFIQLLIKFNKTIIN